MTSFHIRHTSVFSFLRITLVPRCSSTAETSCSSGPKEISNVAQGIKQYVKQNLKVKLKKAYTRKHKQSRSVQETTKYYKSELILIALFHRVLLRHSKKIRQFRTTRCYAFLYFLTKVLDRKLFLALRIKIPETAHCYIHISK